MTTALVGRAAELATFLPDVLYAGSAVGRAFFAAGGAEVDALRAGLAAVLDQYLIETLDYAIARREADYGVAPDPTLTDPQRRARLRSLARGTGTATVAVVERVAAAFLNGEVPAAMPDGPAYTVTLKFYGPSFGPPPQDVAMRAAVRAVVPANMLIAYEYRWLTWDQLLAAGLTWDQLLALGFTWDQLKGTDPALLVAGTVAPTAPPVQMTWDQMKARGLTWDQLKAKGWTWDQLRSRDPASL